MPSRARLAVLLLAAGLLGPSPAAAAGAVGAKAAPAAPANSVAWLETLSAELDHPSALSRRRAPAVLLHPPLGANGPIDIVWPWEGRVVDADHDYVMGSVVDPKALFTIDGETITVHPDGAFLAWLPVSTGSFTFHARLALATQTVTAERTIFVPPPPEPLPAKPLAVDAASLEPQQDLELRSGDWLTVRMQATPGRRARFRVGSGRWTAMRESDPSLGIYEGALRVAPGETFAPARVEYQIGSGWSSVRRTGSALVSASDATPPVAVVKPSAYGFVSAKIGPDEGFLAFPPDGTRFPATGRDGDEIRVEFGPRLSGWIEAQDVALSTGEPAPAAVSGNIGITVEPTQAVVRVPLGDKVPFTVEESPSLDRVTLHLYWTHGHTNWVSYEGLDEFVREATWRQEASDEMTLVVALRPGEFLWGWHADWDGGTLRLVLRRPPKIDPRRPLAGLRIMLDPGHTTRLHDGATGPLGTREPTANYAIAQAVAARLRRAGAVPLLTRASLTDDVPLAERPVLAVQDDADLFVSIHNNGLPDAVDPLADPHGYMVFYYYPHSLDLARTLHASYVMENPLADEGLKWGNLLVARLSDVPAILVESTMMILPEQEAMLNDPAFRDKLAKALVDGLRAFARETGRRERRRR
jgi:N-acetylmuramoyl-L-alanine amidase